MQWFIDHPKFHSNPFYIGGGSYSGLVTGPVVQKVYEGNHQLNQFISINLALPLKFLPLRISYIYASSTRAGYIARDKPLINIKV